MFVKPQNAVKVLQFVTPAAVAAGTVNGTAVDATGFSAVLMILLAGTIPAANTVAAKLQDCDTTDGEFADRDELAAALTDAESDTEPKLGYARQAAGKYVRAQVVRTGAGTPTVGWMLLGMNPVEAPVT